MGFPYAKSRMPYCLTSRIWTSTLARPYSAVALARCGRCLDGLRSPLRRCAPRLLPTVWTRGAKRRTKIKLEELPQGTLSLKPLPSEVEPTYPTVIQQARTNMDIFPNCVVLTRVGSFYEVCLTPGFMHGIADDGALYSYTSSTRRNTLRF